MRAISSLAFLSAALVSTPAVCAAPLIIDHTAVDKYSEIPQQYIDEVKKMWFVLAGESHSLGYRKGVLLLEASEARFAANVTESGTPEAYTTEHLRVSRATWGDVRGASNWTYGYGEEDWYTSDLALERTKAGTTYCNTHNLEVAAMGFGWCWDATWHNTPGGGVDPVYQVRWAGSSVGGPDGDLRWGLDAEDTELTGNRVCMDTYLDATQQYVDYCWSNGYPTKVFFTTGAIDGNSGETAYQRHLKYEHIRNYVRSSADNILFDYADILSWNNAGQQNLKNWTDLGGTPRTYQLIHPDNMIDLNGSYAEDGDHIGEVGTVRLAKAMWVMLAQMAGWDPSAGETNTAPTIDTIADQTVNEGALLQLTVTAHDADAGQTLSFRLGGSPPAGASIDAASGAFAWTPDESAGPGERTITAVGTDSGSPALSATNQFDVLVREVNVAPQLAVPPDRTIYQTDTLSVTNLAVDIDVPANTLTFALVSPPVGMTIDAATGVIQWTPGTGFAVGPVTVNVTVTDHSPEAVNETHLTTSGSFVVTVESSGAANSAPIVEPIPAQTVPERTALSVQVLITDPDAGQNHVFSLTGTPPAGATIGASDGLLTWTPAEDQGPGNYTIAIKVEDDGTPPLSGTGQVQVTVREVNQAPQLDPIADQVVYRGQPVNITLTATDADLPANSLSYDLVDGPEGMSVESTGAVGWTPTAVNPDGPVTVTVEVSDSSPDAVNETSLSHERSFVLTVREFEVGASVSEGELALQFPSVAGAKYRVEYSETAVSCDWQTAQDNIEGDGDTVSVSVPVDSAAARYYRVVLVSP